MVKGTPIEVKGTQITGFCLVAQVKGTPFEVKGTQNMVKGTPFVDHGPYLPGNRAASQARHGRCYVY